MFYMQKGGEGGPDSMYNYVGFEIERFHCVDTCVQHTGYFPLKFKAELKLAYKYIRIQCMIVIIVV